MMRHRVLTISLAVAGVGFAGPSAQAATKYWSSIMGGKFTAAKNWKPAGPPRSMDIARFDLSGAYTISFTANRASQQLLVGNDKVVFDLARHSYDIRYSSNGALSLGLKSGDIARMTIRNGTLTDYRAAIGAIAGSSGNVTVSGATWSTRNSLNIGAAGTGGVTILAGGKVSSATASLGTAKGTKGTVTVSSGGTWEVGQTLAVGSKFADSAAVTIASGANVLVKGLMDIRKGATVSLTGGKLSAGSISRIGKLDFVTGEIELTRSKFVVGKSGLFGAVPVLKSNQTVTVTGIAQVLYRSVLTMDGGTLRAGLLTNAGEIRFNGLGTLAGNSLTNDGLLRGTGEVNSATVMNRGEIRAYGADNLLFGGNVNNSGRINLLSGGTIDFTGTLTNNAVGTIGGSGTLRSAHAVANNGLMNFTEDFAQIDADLRNIGRVDITGNSVTFLRDVIHDGTLLSASPASSALFLGDVSGYGSFSGGGGFRFEGGYNPGSAELPPINVESSGLALVEGPGPAAHVEFDGSVSFGSGGTLTLDLAALRTADRVDVFGDLYLNDVSIRMSPEFTPVAGDQYTLLTAAYIQYGGTIRVPAGPFVVVSGPQSLVLQVIPEPASGAMAFGLAGLLCLRRQRRASRA